MPAKSRKKTPWSEFESETEDGRRKRSDYSRRRILEALYYLIREGDATPSAIDVAARANVGLRTVFRHFEDMDTLYEEMTDEVAGLTMPRILAPFETNEWQDQLMEFVDRNAELFELIFPMQVALSIRRFDSDFLQKQHDRETNLLRTSLKSILPKHIVKKRPLFAAIEVTLAFPTWRRLREDQNLSIENAKETLKLTLSGLITRIDAS
ncbi:MAG: TetR/AcrR family transcriptional regulator [Pseudomonadota bacterium]